LLPPKGSPQGWGGCRRLQDCFRNSLLVLERQSNYVGFSDRTARCLVRCGDDEIRQGSALNLSRTPEQLVHARW
jgi:hypothetical protein